MLNVVQTFKVKGRGHSVKMSSHHQITALFFGEIGITESNSNVRIISQAGK